MNQETQIFLVQIGIAVLFICVKIWQRKEYMKRDEEDLKRLKARMKAEPWKYRRSPEWDEEVKK